MRIRVPIQFFDAPFKWEEAREAASAMKALSDPESLIRRVPQPYHALVNAEPEQEGEDLLPALFGEMNIGSEPRLRIVVGAAGAGKSVLYQALFSKAYGRFQEVKAAQQLSARPIAFIPDYLREAIALRTEALVESFLRTEVAAPVRLAAFEWMLVNGLTSWLFDGLDELYSGDPDFFEYLLDLLTRPGSRAQILLCARDSLLTSSAGFARFLDQFPPSQVGIVRVYRLKDWEHSTKRAFAWVSFEGRLPREGDQDSNAVNKFISAISKSASLRALSAVPYYCGLLAEECEAGTLTDVEQDYVLIERAISGIVKREISKGLLSLDQFEPDGLLEWLRTIAWEFYQSEFKGLPRADIEEYGNLVLRPELSPSERKEALTTLAQFPLFSPGLKPGLVNFKHELIAEFLAGAHLSRRIRSSPAWVAQTLGTRIDFAGSLIARFIASGLAGKQENLEAITQALRTEALPGRAFPNLLQILLLARPEGNLLKTSGIPLEGRDIRYVQFSNMDLTGISFRNCDLSDTTFKACDLKDALFEGACMSGTRFEDFTPERMTDARFGGLERFEFIYAGRQRIDSIKSMSDWLRKMTGRIEDPQEACAAAMQVRTLFLKFVHPNGQARCDELREIALGRGKKYAGAPSPQECLRASIKAGYLQEPDWRTRVKRAPGDRYTERVHFIRDWKLAPLMKQLLDSICAKPSCKHLPRLTQT